MNENINIAEILKDAPQGTKLWSPMLGDYYYGGLFADVDIQTINHFNKLMDLMSIDFRLKEE